MRARQRQRVRMINVAVLVARESVIVAAVD